MREHERPSFAPTRRSLAGMLGATVAVAVPASAIAAPAAPDAELIALGRDLKAAWAIERVVYSEVGDDDSDAEEAKCEAAAERCSDITRRIEALTATTLAGLRVKLLALQWCVNGDPLTTGSLFGDEHATTDHRMVCSILADLRTAA